MTAVRRGGVRKGLNNTQDHCIHNQPPSSIPVIPPTSTFNAKLPLSASFSNVTIANDSSAQNIVPGLLKPRSKLHIGASNVRTLCQIGQQASLARTLESRTIHVCCVPETRVQDPSVVIHLTSPQQDEEPTRYTLRVGIALSMRAEQALIRKDGDTRRCLFVVSAYKILVASEFNVGSLKKAET
ncbi:uncharacterized protein DC041_0012140 [Schistosoma bovis]|uniref:Uncharacterized protein n=1 Tax=Schistosoma bovis TaxID=6184 RepID=A0A430Q6W6_SCHBO|nr:uncharacterized protein DC041_0012140 [Schistosoma bovis]